MLGLHRAIAEVTEPRGLAEYADAAADYAVELCACSRDASQRIVEAFRSARPSTDIVQIDPTCLIWNHVAESDDWCYVTARCGADCPEDLAQALRHIESW
jgi:hypothetical protein